MEKFQPKILVVDDEPIMLEVLQEALTQAKCVPHCVESGQEAMNLINHEKFDAVFLDWMMPGMDGLELARQISESERNCYCPIIMVTGNTEPGRMKKCFEAGINFFLQKPFSFEDIQRLVTVASDMMLQERLRYHRFPVGFPVLCRWQNESATMETEGLSFNLGSYGMSLTLDSPPPSEMLVNVQFTLPKDSEPMDLSAWVLHVWPNNKIGVRFINLSREQRKRLLRFAESALTDIKELES